MPKKNYFIEYTEYKTRHPETAIVNALPSNKICLDGASSHESTDLHELPATSTIWWDQLPVRVEHNAPSPV